VGLSQSPNYEYQYTFKSNSVVLEYCYSPHLKAKVLQEYEKQLFFELCLHCDKAEDCCLFAIAQKLHLHEV